jgi:hypothetical protein
MVITDEPIVLVSEDFSEAEHARSPGLHLSQIITSLNEVRGTRYPPSDDATKENYFALGFVWERILAQVFVDVAVKKSAGLLVRPGELHLDGIAMSPDALDLDEYVLEEYKCTWLSANRSIHDACFWHWIVQIRAYCRALGTRHARLRVFFVAGDWRGGGPKVKMWRFEFNQQELDDNWAMIVNQARSKGWL